MPSRIRLALIAGGIALLASVATAQTAQYISSYTWANSDKGFGGFSGIEVSGDGMKFTAIGDRGAIITGQFERDGAQISDIISTIQELKNAKGNALTKFQSDAEGLAIRADGRIYISFEQFHRVWTYRDPESEAARIPRHADFEHLKNNGGLEALAIDPDGTLYALPEKSGGGAITIYRYKGGVWDAPYQIPQLGAFKTVGADFGPDGKLYVLERALTSIFGFQTQVRRFDIKGDRIGKGELILQTSPGTHDNLEGLSVWRGTAGDIRLTMISDDNFNIFQHTEFVEYRLQE
ncbi:MAG: esterase-like activity of phytase family protein [Marinosulfonomonas sp.]|nr:esterase-like activity of phytase family protein [Marinosulfonomonas sp.]